MKFHLRYWPIAILFLAIASCLEPEDPIEQLPSSPPASQFSNDVVWEWSELYLKIEKDLPGFRPAPTCRALGYISMGAYETVVPGMEHYRTMHDLIPGFPALEPIHLTYQINWPIALNAYYARTYRFFLFNATEEHQFKMESLEAEQLLKLRQGVPDGIVFNSIEWGRTVADEIISFSEKDREGATQCRAARPTNYNPPVGTGLWIPTAPDYGAAMFPYWGKTRAFVSSQAVLTSEPPSYAYSTDPSSNYYKDNLEVSNAISNLTHEDRWIAEFWSDDLTGLTFSPPARILAIANQLIAIENPNLEETIHFYCKLGIAINDAAVGCWKSKYIYNTERPETYIRQHINPNFRPILGEAIGVPGVTPSFPGYPSGHSTFAGVSWKIFDEFFGENYQFTDLCHYGRTEFNGFPRTYTSWKQMAEENAFSRIPLGVHIRMDCTEGLRLGYEIASKAVELDLTK